jgi:hypothetical protein
MIHELNEGRTKTSPENRLATDAYFNAIIRAANTTRDFEFCAIEAKPRLNAGKASTPFKDHDKLLEGLSSMLSRLVGSVKAVDVKRVEVFGLMLAGILSPLSIA